MKLLLKAVLRHKKHLILLGFSLLSILGLTISSQAEIFSLGIIAKTGPDAFVLFANKKNNRLVKEYELSQQQILAKWSEISPGSDRITLSQANAYIAQYGN